MDFLEKQEQGQLERIADAIEAEARAQGFTMPACTVVVHGDRRAIRFTSTLNPHVDRDRGAGRALWLWPHSATGRWLCGIGDGQESFYTELEGLSDGAGLHDFPDGLPSFSELLKGWAP
jgi:hypothetical protein